MVLVWILTPSISSIIEVSILFKEIEKNQKFDETNYFNKEDLIYFSKKEQRKIDSLAYNFTNDIIEQYCILCGKADSLQYNRLL